MECLLPVPFQDNVLILGLCYRPYVFQLFGQMQILEKASCACYQSPLCCRLTVMLILKTLIEESDYKVPNRFLYLNLNTVSIISQFFYL